MSSAKVLLPNIVVAAVADSNCIKPTQKVQCFKTKKCRFFAEGRCNRGEGCTYAHAVDELRQPPDLQKTKVCAKWRKDQCPLPACKCAYAHGDADLRRNPEEVETEVEEAEAEIFVKCPTVSSKKNNFSRRRRCATNGNKSAKHPHQHNSANNNNNSGEDSSPALSSTSSIISVSTSTSTVATRNSFSLNSSSAEDDGSLSTRLSSCNCDMDDDERRVLMVCKAVRNDRLSAEGDEEEEEVEEEEDSSSLFNLNRDVRQPQRLPARFEETPRIYDGLLPLPTSSTGASPFLHSACEMSQKFTASTTEFMYRDDYDHILSGNITTGDTDFEEDENLFFFEGLKAISWDELEYNIPVAYEE